MTMTPETCPERETHGFPFRYCGVKGCGWVSEPSADVRALREAKALLTDFANMLETMPYLQAQEDVVDAIRLVVGRTP